MKAGLLIRNHLRAIYLGGLVCAAAVLFLGLSYVRLRENDLLSLSEDTACYVDGTSCSDEDSARIVREEAVYGITAEWQEIVTFYPGTYEVTICARTEMEDAWFQVVELSSGRVLAEHEYTVGEEYHVVRFTTQERFEGIAVRSYMRTDAASEASEDDASDAQEESGDLAIYGYTLSSDGTICNDAKWTMLLMCLVVLLLALGLLRAVCCGKRAFLAATVMALLGSLPFMINYVPDGNDVAFHLSRIESLGLSISAGILPQRLTLTLGGLSIEPIMYPEVLLYGAGYMCSRGATVMLAWQANCIFLTFLTVYLAYCAGRQVFGERGALLFALLYELNPFRMNELMVRAAVGEASAMAFLPLVAVGMWRLLFQFREVRDGAETADITDRHKICREGFLDLAIGFTGLISTHIVSCVLAAVLCLLMGLAAALVHPVRFVKNWRRLLTIPAAAVTVVVVNAWYLVPFLQYFGWETWIRQPMYENMQYSTPYLWQIFMGSTGSGHDNGASESAYGEMSLTIGFVLLLGALLFLAMRIEDTIRGNRYLWAEQPGGTAAQAASRYSLPNRTESGESETEDGSPPNRKPGGAQTHTFRQSFRKRPSSSNRDPGGAEAPTPYLTRKEAEAGTLLLVLSGVFLYLCSTWFPWVWLCERVPLLESTLGSIQFSWRILVLDVLLLTALLVLVLRALVRRAQPLSYVLLALLLTLAAVTGLDTATDYYNVQDQLESRYDVVECVNVDYVLLSADLDGVREWILSGDGPAVSDGEVSESDSGSAWITEYVQDGTDYTFSFENPSGEELTVTVPVLWYGLHTAWLSSEDSGSNGSESVAIISGMNEELQFTDVVIPAGVTAGTVTLVYTEPSSWQAAEWVSAAAAFVLAVLAALWVVQRVRNSSFCAGIFSSYRIYPSRDGSEN